ncbi:MAG TPA: TetR/AcrR family transcriptional regulator [Caulobacteraceae bacterium]|jgi:AcrR family transcriptional regulator|nr:TetR/AcrR family transcriptional regulator [Caulobacteraceae bacterium]
MTVAPMTTRTRILDATLALVERAKGPIAMGAIAKAAGLSRQALYLTFADKADLFIALVRYVDGKRGLAEELAKIRDAPTGVDALMGVVDLQARLNPGLKPLADAFGLLRRQDRDAEKAWQDRLEHRLAGCRAVVDRIAAEDRLRPGLDQAVAADLVWTLTSLRTWNDLVVHRNWTADEYRERVSALLMASIVG